VARHEQALLAMTQQSAAGNASHSSSAHPSRWLLRARDLYGGEEELPLTRESLARRIGVQRNAISIVAHSLQLAGMNRYSGGCIDIINPGRPKATACECRDAVNAHRRRLLKIRTESSAPEPGTPSSFARRCVAQMKWCRKMHLYANFPCQRCV
jgi:Crp-like helix-turn-helix protein